jgi:hypothetical protein
MALLLAIGMSAADVARLNDETRPEVLGSWSSSKYDAKNNRCYVRIYEHTRRKSSKGVATSFPRFARTKVAA